MKKAYALLISLSFLCSTVYSDTAVVPETPSTSSTSEAFVTLTRTAISNKDLPANTEFLIPEEFNGWSAQTAGEAAQRMTSVQVRPVAGLGGAQVVQIRGASTPQNVVLIDGRPINGVSFSSNQDLTEIPVENIDHIEVVRGGISALYGPNAIGGVLNVITRRGPANGQAFGSAGYDYGSYGRNIFRATASAKSGPVDIFAYGNTQHEDGFRDNSKADTLNAGANLGFALPGAAGKILLEGSFYQGEIGVPGRNFLPTNQFNNHDERVAATQVGKQDIDTKALRVAYTVPMPMNSLLSVKAWGTDRRAIFKDNFVDGDTMQSSRGAEAQVNLPLGLVVGSNFTHDREDSTDHITPTNTFIRFVEDYAFFAQDTMKWKAITLIPSGRFDHHSQFGDTANPRVQALADAMPWLRFSGSAARSFRAPEIDNLYYPFTDFGPSLENGRQVDGQFGGNPDLKPERAWTYDAGFELYNDVASFKATYFRANVTNLIQNAETRTINSGTLADPDISLFHSVNVGNARRQGLEIQLDHRVNEYFKDGVNYTYLQNVGTPNGFLDYVQLPYSPRHKANYFATMSPTKSFDWTNTLRYQSDSYSDNNRTGTKLSSRVLWDMRLAYRWQILESYFQVSDLLDRRYIEQAGFPLPGRTFIGGVTLRFGGPK